MSAQIAALEAVFGEKLFRRTGRSLVLTEAGDQVLSYAKEIFSLGEELVSAIRHQPTSRRLRVNVGIVDSMPKLLANEVIKPVFHLDRPIQVTCLEGKLAELLAQLATYRLDLVLADEPAPSTMNIQVFNHLLGESSVTFCAEARLATKLKRGFPRSLNDAPALLPTVDTPLRRSLEKWFQAQGIRPRLVGEFEDAALMKVVAVDGLGFLPLPTLVAAEAVARYGLRSFGSTDACRQQFYAISAERKLTHPAVFAITSTARKSLFAHDRSPFPARESGMRPSRAITTPASTFVRSEGLLDRGHPGKFLGDDQDLVLRAGPPSAGIRRLRPICWCRPTGTGIAPRCFPAASSYC